MAKLAVPAKILLALARLAIALEALTHRRQHTSRGRCADLKPLDPEGRRQTTGAFDRPAELIGWRTTHGRLDQIIERFLQLGLRLRMGLSSEPLAMLPMFG
jgi:hypothetical protein